MPAQLEPQTEPPPPAGRRALVAAAPVLLALIVAAALRFAALERWPLWCDELATLQRLELPFAQHVLAMKGNHPLYELLLRCWMPLDGSDRWMRLPSAALGVLAVWLTWLLLRSVGRREALLATWLVALSPLHLMYSRIARAYSLACVLALLSNLALLYAVKRRRSGPLLAYAFLTALMIYSNLLAASLWTAQALFLLWFYRRRLRKLTRWLLAHAAVGLLLLPWMLFSLRSAVVWGQETHYTARQLGHVYKVAHVAMALCVGETVHPLNLTIVSLALLGFGCATLMGILCALKRPRGIAAFLLVQAAFGFGVCLYFAAASPKHITILLPAWLGLTAIGLARLKSPMPAVVAGAFILLAMTGANANYFAGREFTDADMVTPWRDMARYVHARQQPSDSVIIGYQMDRGAYDMFRRYYRGPAAPEYLDFDRLRSHLRARVQPGRSLWLLLHGEDPWRDVEVCARERGWTAACTPFQNEEHTLKGLRQWRASRKAHRSCMEWLRSLPACAAAYRSPLYRLYRIQAPRSNARKGATP